MQVDLGRVDALVAEPEGDHGGVDAGVEESHGGGVAEDVQRHLLVVQARCVPGGVAEVFGEPTLERVAAESSALPGREERLGCAAAAFAGPGAEGGDGGSGERGDALFSALAVAADVGAEAEVEVAAVEPGQLRGAQAGLDCEQQQRVVTAASPGGAVGAGEQRLDLWLGQEADQGAVEPLGGIASTRWIRAACSGWRSAAKR